MREKLIECYLKSFDKCLNTKCRNCEYFPEPQKPKRRCQAAMVADDLIANGVTIAKDNNVPIKWIPVTERLPEDPLQTVLVTNGKETCVAVYSVVYDEFGVMCGRGQDKRFGVTHWMPLPEPPEE